MYNTLKTHTNVHSAFAVDEHVSEKGECANFMRVLCMSEGSINANLIVYVDVIVNQAEFVYACIVSCLPKIKRE